MPNRRPREANGGGNGTQREAKREATVGNGKQNERRNGRQNIVATTHGIQREAKREAKLISRHTW